MLHNWPDPMRVCISLPIFSFIAESLIVYMDNFEETRLHHKRCFVRMGEDIN